MAFDYFGVQIEVGDMVSFPTSGIMEDGKVLDIFNRGRQITIINISGYKKKKYCKDVINKTKTEEALKEKFPEEFV